MRVRQQEKFKFGDYEPPAHNLAAPQAPHRGVNSGAAGAAPGGEGGV